MTSDAGGHALRLGEGFQLPLDAVTETFAILAKRRAGKSNAAVVMAEEMYSAGLPWIAVDPKGDWWGIRAGGDGHGEGLSVVVFGGLHGDVPLEPTSGRLVADLVAERRLTCVLDVSEMTKADQRRFLADFAERLYRANRLPLHIYAEEADAYIPQVVRAADARVVGAWESLVKRGGFRGIGVTLVSQRSASLNKGVLSQVESIFAMRTTSPQDRRAILAWVEHHEAGIEAVAELPSLSSGQAWMFSPQWLNTLEKVTFRRRRTFDSGATPKVGVVAEPPARLAPVDLEKISQAMAATIERSDATDPAALQRRISQLERELAAAGRRRTPAPKTVEIPVISNETVAEMTAAVDELTNQLHEHQAHLDSLQAAVATVDTTLSHVKALLADDAPASAPPSVEAPRRPAPGPRRPAAAPAAAAPEDQQDRPQLRAGARRMVESLGRMAPLRLTKAQWGTVARLKTSGGTWSTYLSEIRRAGLLDETAVGFTLSEAGFAYLGERPQPLGAHELQDHYRSILRSGAAKMLDVLIAAYPRTLTREELGDAADLAVTGGTFSTYLSDLTRNGLAEKRDGGVVATDVLMFGAEA